jgi:hypothetical protein
MLKILLLLFAAMFVHSASSVVDDRIDCRKACQCKHAHNWTVLVDNPCAVKTLVAEAVGPDDGCCDIGAEPRCPYGKCTGSLRKWTLVNNCGCILVPSHGGAGALNPPPFPAGATSGVMGGGRVSLDCGKEITIVNGVFCLGVELPFGYVHLAAGTHTCSDPGCAATP